MKTNIYITVRLEVISEKPLTEEQKEEIVNDVDYDFYFDKNGMEIIETEITDSIKL